MRALEAIAAFAREHRLALSRNFVCQAVAMLLGSILLDGGYTFRIIAPSVSGYWTGVFLITARRAEKRLKDDIQFIQIGWCALLMVTPLIQWGVMVIGMWMLPADH